VDPGSGIKAARATIAGCDLSGADLTDADLTAADLTGSDLSALDPRRVRLEGAIITVEQAVEVAEALGLVVQESAHHGHR